MRFGKEEAERSAGKAPGIWSVAFVSLLAINFFQAMGQQTAVAVIPLYARDLGAAASIIGVLTGAFGLSALAVRPLAGPAFDSFPKKWMLFGALIDIALATMLYAQATTLTQILLVRLMHGLGMGFSGPLALSLASETLPSERMSSGISIYMLSMSVAQAIGPAFGIWLSQTIGYAVTFRVSACSLVIACVLIALLKPPAEPERPPYQLRLDRIFAREAVLPALMIALLSASFSCTGSFMAIYGGLRGVEGIGAYFTVYALCLLVTRPVLGRVSDNHGITVVLVPAMLAFALSYVLLSMTSTFVGFLLCAAVAACGFGICMPLLQSLVFKCVSDDRRGAGSNTSYSGLDIGNLLGPYLGGFAIEMLAPLAGSEVGAYSAMWLVMIVPIAIALVIFLSSRRRIAGYAMRKQRLVKLAPAATEGGALDD